MTVRRAATQTNLISGEEPSPIGDIGPCELGHGRMVQMSPTGYEHGNIEP